MTIRVDDPYATDPTGFPYGDGEPVRVIVVAQATSDVPCTYCGAEPKQPCRFEPHQLRVAEGKVHRSRLSIIPGYIASQTGPTP